MWNVSKDSRAAAHLSSKVSTRRIGRSLLLALLALVLMSGTALATVYHTLQSNISQVDVSKLLGEDRPTSKSSNPDDPSAGHPLNILVLGSDVRSGASDIDGSGKKGQVTGMRADTTMLFHISSDRTRIDVVSIPRDMLLPLPACTVLKKDGSTYEAKAEKEGMFNAAFAKGGTGGEVSSAAACSMKTVEQFTGIRLDGFIVVDFNSFQQIVEALGGIPMYFPEAIRDKYSGLNVPAGCRLLHGDQALALARARKQVGDGSDISRIGRQQELVTAMIKEVRNLNLFTDVTKLYSVMNAVTSSLTTSEGLGNIQYVAGLAYSLRDIDLSKVNFITMPWEWAGNRVSPGKYVDILWEALINDHPLTVEKNANQTVVTDTTTGANTATGKSVASGKPSSGATTSPTSPAASPTTPAPSSSASTPAQSTPSPQPTQSPSVPVCTKSNAVG